MNNVTWHGQPFAVLLLTMLSGAGILALGVRNVRRTQNLRRTGAKAYGQVVRHNIMQTRGYSYSPVVAWQTPDGRRHEYSCRMYGRWKRRFKVDARVVIYYDPADSDRAMLDGYDGTGAWVVVVLGAALLCFGLFLLVTIR